MRRFAIAMLPLTFLAAALQVGCAPPPPGAPASWLTAPTPAQHVAFPIEKGWHAVDCNSCHRGTGTFKSFDCLGCHTEPATPPRPYGPKRGSRHYRQVTLACHAAPHANRPKAAGLAQKDGLFCHSATQTTHVGGPGFSFESTACLGCHPAGTR